MSQVAADIVEDYLGQLFVPDGRDYKETAYRGDLSHKLAVHVLTGVSSSPVFLKLITNENQAAWLSHFAPELLPPSAPDGTKPSVHSVATRFEFLYEIHVAFRKSYHDSLSAGLWIKDGAQHNCRCASIEHKRISVSLALGSATGGGATETVIRIDYGSDRDD